MSTQVSFEVEVKRWGVGLMCAIEGTYSPGDPGRTYGPPERCYPPEGAEFNPTEIKITDIDGVVVEGGAFVDNMLDFYSEFADEIDTAADEAYRSKEEADIDDAADRIRDAKLADDNADWLDDAAKEYP